MLNQILLGDCYELMKSIPDGSLDLVLTDPPYNTTACEWDKQPIDLVELWKHLKRVLKPKGAVVMTGSQPFTTDLIMSNRKWFGYELIWDKVQPTGALSVDLMPMKQHENILIFYKFRSTYNKQMTPRPKKDIRPNAIKNKLSQKNNFGYEHTGGTVMKYADDYDPTKVNPKSILTFSKQPVRIKNFHPTQKPVALFEYLIRTYSNPGETILDPFAGSGTTALAAHNAGRNFICMEREEKYWQIANKRLALAQSQLRFEEMVG